MGSARVRVGGKWIDAVAPASGLTDSTIFRSMGDPASVDEIGFSGDYEARVDWAAPPDYSAPWLVPGFSTFEVVEMGVVTWAGVLAEATPPSEPGGRWLLVAYGFGNDLTDYLALSGTTITSIPNTAIDQAATRGAYITRNAVNIGSTAVGAADERLTVMTVLARAGLNAAKRPYVDSNGIVTLVSDPTAPIWGARPATAFLGSPDDQYMSHLYGYYYSATGVVSVVLNSDTATSAETVKQLGRKERGVDLTALGVITAFTAQAIVDGRFALGGARMGWTNPIDINSTNFRRLGWGSADPMSMCGANGAGTMVRLFGVTDSRSKLEVQFSANVILGEVVRKHQDRTVVATPIGFKWRDFQGLLAAAQPPDKPISAA